MVMLWFYQYDHAISHDPIKPSPESQGPGQGQERVASRVGDIAQQTQQTFAGRNLGPVAQWPQNPWDTVVVCYGWGEDGEIMNE